MRGIEHLVRYSFLFLLLLLVEIKSQRHPNDLIDSILDSGIHQLRSQNYIEATIIFSSLDSLFPDNPLGKIYLAANEITKTVDYEEDFNSDYIDSLLSLAEDKTNKLLAQNKNIWNKYYSALLHGYKAYYDILKNNLINAFSNGLISIKTFEECIKEDKNFTEAYIAIGTYLYWKSAKTKSLLWLPFISDKREEGIKLLESASCANSYNKYFAQYSLIWIYIDNNESQKAVDLAHKVLEQDSSSRFFMWGLARALEDINKQEAIKTYYKLLKSVETIKNRNFYNDVVILHKIAMLYEEEEDLLNALNICNQILNFDIKLEKVRNRLDERLSRVNKLKTRLEKKIDS